MTHTEAIQTIREKHEYPADSIAYLQHRANYIGEVNTLYMLEYVGRLECTLAALDSLAVEPSEDAVKRIVKCQKILADYIVPDSGISDHDVIIELIGVLDKPLTVESSEDATAKPRTNSDNDAIKFIKSLERVQFTDYCNRQGIALITARDERIKDEIAESLKPVYELIVEQTKEDCADKAVEWFVSTLGAYLSTHHMAVNDTGLRAAIMGRKE